MAYHVGVGDTLLFGGCGGVGAANVTVRMVDGTTKLINGLAWCAPRLTSGDTWVWNNGSWEAADTSWVWNTTTKQWEDTDALAAPHPRAYASMGYDWGRNALVLFGGTYTVASDSPNWAPPAGSTLAAAAPKRCDHSVEAPPLARLNNDTRNLLTPPPYIDYSQFTASDGSARYVHYYCFDDTWILRKMASGWRWSQETPTTRPPARFDAGLAHDRNGDVVLHGGCNAQGIVGNWWDCYDWNAYDEINPLTNRPYGEERETNYARDTWVYRADAVGAYNWVRLNPPSWCKDNNGTPDCRRAVQGSTTFDPQNLGTVFVHGGYWAYVGSYGQQPYLLDEWARNSVGWRQVCPEWDLDCNRNDPVTAPAQPDFRAWTNDVYAWIDGDWHVVTFGGESYSNETNTKVKFNDLWMFVETQTVGSWVQVCPSATCATSPPQRSAAGMAYDRASGKLVVFGGLSVGGAFLGDTYTLSLPAPLAANPCPSCHPVQIALA